jgi:Ser/Thr protein kinase RdoA (MazF antagonist)
MVEAIKYNLHDITSNFQVEGEFVQALPHGSGHINDTFLAHFRTGNGDLRYIHQRINHNVFKHPEQVMENITRVTAYAHERIRAEGGDPLREALTLVPARDGRSFYQDPQGNTWRTYVFIDNGARTYDSTTDLHVVYSAARAFGGFQRLLSGLPGERLHETIPNFHHTRKRFESFVQAVNADPANRAAKVKSEIDFLLKREADASVVVDLLEQGRIPERVIHNDTKINNVMIDDRTGEGVCVLDLDTVMPGSALYDFGDMVRAGTAMAAEDEVKLSKVGVDLKLFTQLARGYLSMARDFLTQAEFELLAFSGKLITYEQALRFLGDYLNGDVYYKIHHERHNLDRARTQIRMVREMEDKMGLMEAIVEKCKNQEE